MGTITKSPLGKVNPFTVTSSEQSRLVLQTYTCHSTGIGVSLDVRYRVQATNCMNSRIVFSPRDLTLHKYIFLIVEISQKPSQVLKKCKIGFSHLFMPTRFSSLTLAQVGTSLVTHSKPCPGTQCPEKPHTECSPALHQEDVLRGCSIHCTSCHVTCNLAMHHALQLTGLSSKYSSISLDSFSCTSGWSARR